MPRHPPNTQPGAPPPKHEHPKTTQEGKAPRPVSGPFLDLVEDIHAPTGRVLKRLYAIGGFGFVYAFVISPLLIALLAAFWLILWAKIKVWPFDELHGKYLETIQQGFSLKDAAESTMVRYNKRIDYVQAIEFTLSQIKPSIRVPTEIEPGRLAQIDLRLSDVAPGCRKPISETSAKQTFVSVDVYMKTRRGLIGKLDTQNAPDAMSIPLNAAWWSNNWEYVSNYVKNDAAIVVERSEGGGFDGCPELNGTLRISVYRTIVYPPEAGAASSVARTSQ
jgi:hypothetical protein